MLALVAVLVAARLTLPTYLRSHVNRVLDQSREYDGHVGEIEVHLWRGAYSINGLRIVKTTRSVPVPFFEARRLDLSIDWRALLHGQARGRILMDRPRLNFVHGPTPEETQTGADQPWLAIMDDLFPFRIDRFEAREGEVHFHAFHTRPEVDVFLSEVDARVTNLTNVENRLDPLMASVEASGLAMGSGRFEFDMRLDPNSHLPAFTLATRILGLDARQLNSLTRAYANFDFEAGEFDFVVEASAKDGLVDGYAKPLLRGVRVLGTDDARGSGPLQIAWEGAVGAVATLFRNQPRQQFGTRVAFEGQFDNPRVNILDVVGNVLRNAFIRAYLPRIEGRIAPELTTQQEGRGAE